MNVCQCVWGLVVPTRGAHQLSPKCVELKPPAARRRIGLFKYSSSAACGTTFSSLLTDPCCSEPRHWSRQNVRLYGRLWWRACKWVCSYFYFLFWMLVTGLTCWNMDERDHGAPPVTWGFPGGWVCQRRGRFWAWMYPPAPPRLILPMFESTHPSTGRQSVVSPQ